jgi:hypothetical protein
MESKCFSKQGHFLNKNKKTKTKNKKQKNKKKQKKHKPFGIKIYKLCGSKEYTYDIRVYLGKGRKFATGTMTSTHATVAGLTTWIENVRHVLYINKFILLLN